MVVKVRYKIRDLYHFIEEEISFYYWMSNTVSKRGFSFSRRDTKWGFRIFYKVSRRNTWTSMMFVGSQCVLVLVVSPGNVSERRGLYVGKPNLFDLTVRVYSTYNKGFRFHRVIPTVEKYFLPRPCRWQEEHPVKKYIGLVIRDSKNGSTTYKQRLKPAPNKGLKTVCTLNVFAYPIKWWK